MRKSVLHFGTYKEYDKIDTGTVEFDTAILNYTNEIMNWKEIKTEAAYQGAIKRTLQIFNAEPNTAEGNELELLLLLVKDYDDTHIYLSEINNELGKN